MKSDNLPLISVIMPVYNRENYVAKAIESVLNQTYRNFEFIIIDDGSTDSSVNIIENYAEQDDRIKLTCNKENKGIYFSRNLGNSLSKGEFIAVMDSDDICLPARFEKQLEYFVSHPNIDVLGTQSVEIDHNGNRLQNNKYPLTYGQVRWDLIFGRSLCHPSLMLRKNCFDKSGIKYAEKQVSQDYDLLVRLSHLVNIENHPYELVLIRKHPQNISIEKRAIQLEEAYDTIRLNINMLINEELTDEVISGLVIARHQKKHPQIANLKAARKVSNVIVKLMQKAMKWEIAEYDRSYIRQNTASRLRHIWKNQKFHPFLLPYVLYSLILDPDVIKRNLTQHFE